MARTKRRASVADERAAAAAAAQQQAGQQGVGIPAGAPGAPQSFRKGGTVKRSGVYRLEKGEKVTPAKAVHAHERRLHAGKPLTRLPKGRKK